MATYDCVGGFACPYATLVLAKGNIEHPAKLVLDSSVASGCRQSVLGRELATRRDVVPARQRFVP